MLSAPGVSLPNLELWGQKQTWWLILFQEDMIQKLQLPSLPKIITHRGPWSKSQKLILSFILIGDLVIINIHCVVLVPGILKQLENLRLNNRKTQSFRYAKSSADNVKSAIRQYLYFTNYFRLQQLPASVDTLVCFMEFMARTSGFGHLKHLLSSVKFLHEAMDFTFQEDSFQLDTTMQGLKRRLANVPFQVLPLTPQVLRKIFQKIDLSNAEDRALWASYLAAFYGLLRKSNVVPKPGSFDPRKVLVKRNIKVDLQNNLVYLYIGFSKTNQFGARDVIIPIPGNSDPALDPVRHLHAAMMQNDGGPDSPAFSFAPGKFINYTKFTLRLKELLRMSGLNPDLYSGHSFRRAGATFLHECGGTALMVQSTGGWQSQCFTRYLYLTESERLKAQSLISRGISMGL